MSNNRFHLISSKRAFASFVFPLLRAAIILVLGTLLLRSAVLQFTYGGAATKEAPVTSVENTDTVAGAGSPGSVETALTELRDWRSIFDLSLFDYPGMDWSLLTRQLAFTCAMVLIALFWSTVLALILGYQLAKKPHASYWNVLSGIFTLASGLPLFVVGLLLSAALVRLQGMAPSEGGGLINVIAGFIAGLFPTEGSYASAILKLLLGGLLLGSFEGALGEWPRNFRAIFSELLNKTYYLAHRASGRSTAGLAYRAVRPYLLQSLATRVSYLFGGVIVVEWALDFRQLGYNFLEKMSPRFPFGYCDVMVSGILIMAVPILVRMILSFRLQTLYQKG